MLANQTLALDAADELSNDEWSSLLSPETWLGHTTPPEYLAASVKEVYEVATQDGVRSFFAERFPGYSKIPESLLQRFLDADVNCISHALSALLLIKNKDAKRFLPPGIRDAIGVGIVNFDHIGVEVFGKLEWYIEMLDRAYSTLGIKVTGAHIFPSVQVRSALQYDDQLGDVRIARVHFSRGENNVNLELFEATQCWKYIALRQASLFACLSEPGSRTAAFSKISKLALEPVGHVAFLVPNARIVESIQSKLLTGRDFDGSIRMRPYVEKAFFNPADRSTNTKFVVSNALASGQILDSQIVEILSYES